MVNNIGNVYQDEDEGKYCIPLGPVRKRSEAKKFLNNLFGWSHVILLTWGIGSTGCIYVLARWTIFKLRYDYAYGEAQLFGDKTKLERLINQRR